MWRGASNGDVEQEMSFQGGCIDQISLCLTHSLAPLFSDTKTCIWLMNEKWKMHSAMEMQRNVVFREFHRAMFVFVVISFVTQ